MLNEQVLPYAPLHAQMHRVKAHLHVNGTVSKDSWLEEVALVIGGGQVGPAAPSQCLSSL